MPSAKVNLRAVKPPTCSDEAVDPPTSSDHGGRHIHVFQMTVRWEFMIAFRGPPGLKVMNEDLKQGLLAYKGVE